MLGFKPGTDRPASFLAEDGTESRHVNLAVVAGAVLEAFDEPLVTAVAQFQIAKVGRNAAGNGFQAMAARAVLAISGFADLLSKIVAAIGIVLNPGVAELGKSGGIDRLGRDVAVSDQLRADRTKAKRSRADKI